MAKTKHGVINKKPAAEVPAESNGSEAAEGSSKGCSISGIAREWDAIEDVKARLLDGGAPLDPKTPSKTVDNSVCMMNQALLEPILQRMSLLPKRPIPTIDDLRDEVSALMTLSKRQGSDIVAVVEEAAQTIKRLLVFVKAKTRRWEVSTAPEFQNLCLTLDPMLQAEVDKVNAKRKRKAITGQSDDDEDAWQDEGQEGEEEAAEEVAEDPLVDPSEIPKTNEINGSEKVEDEKPEQVEKEQPVATLPTDPANSTEKAVGLGALPAAPLSSSMETAPAPPAVPEAAGPALSEESKKAEMRRKREEIEEKLRLLRARKESNKNVPDPLSLSPPVSGTTAGAGPAAAVTDMQDTLPLPTDICALPVPPDAIGTRSPDVPASAKRESYQIKRGVQEPTLQLGDSGERVSETAGHKADPPSEHPAKQTATAKSLKEAAAEEPYITRQDQLEAKPERGRGRGRRRGRGRGQDTGRGRGKDAGTSGRGGKGQGRKRSTPRAGQSTHKEDDDVSWWDDTWTTEWGHPDEEWGTDGWGEAGYFWDRYAWLEGEEALRSLSGEERSNKKKQDTNTKKKETKRGKLAVDGNASERKRSGGQRTKEKAEPATSSTTKKRKQETQNAGNGHDDQQRRKTKKKSMQDVDAAQSNEDDIKAIRMYHKKFSQDESTEATSEIKELMKKKLKWNSESECRLNAYWKVPACGVTSKSKKKDIARFSFPDIVDLSYMSALALCMKCAHLFAIAVDNGLNEGTITPDDLWKDSEWCASYSASLQVSARAVLDDTRS